MIPTEYTFTKVKNRKFRTKSKTQLKVMKEPLQKVQIVNVW